MRPIAETQDLAEAIARVIDDWVTNNPDLILMDVIVRRGTVVVEASRRGSNERAACQEAPIR